MLLWFYPRLSGYGKDGNIKNYIADILEILVLIREILRLSLGLQKLCLQNLPIMSATSKDHQDVNCSNSLVRDIIIHTLRNRNMVPMNNK